MISIIITTINEESVIENLLKSIQKQTYQDIEIILVDNPKTQDDTCEIVKKYTKNIFVKGSERSEQRNFGVSKAKGKHVLILDADMKLNRNILLELSKIKEEVAIIPEKSYGIGFWTKFKVFEREFYEGENDIEAARYFDKKIFLKYGGYDEKITGPEDYDLPLRMRKGGEKISRIKSYILHNEKKFSPYRSAKKKFYYAYKSANYVKKHPEMVFKQGNMLIRPVFVKKWRKLISHPFLSLGMFYIKLIEMIGAFLGFIYSVIIIK